MGSHLYYITDNTEQILKRSHAKSFEAVNHMFKCFALIFSTQRFDEKKKLLADHDAVLQTITEKLAECQQWQVQHKVMKVVIFP